MKAKLKTIICTTEDDRVYWPDEHDNFCIWVEAEIGPRNQDGAHLYQFQVCTPKWIAKEMINRDFGDYGAFGRYLIIVKEYDWDEIKKMIADLCDKTTGKDWNEIALKLSRYGQWEYADYIVD